MRQGLSWRIGVTVLAIFLSLIYLLPGFAPNSALTRFLPDSRINLGLDLVGGIHLTLSVDVDKAIGNSLVQAGQNIRAVGRDENILILRPRVVAGEKLEFTLARPEQRAALEEMMAKYFPQLVLDPPQSIEEGRLRYIASFRPQERAEMTRMALGQVLTAIRNRIDQFGVAEPDIREQPENNRIIIQLPGIKDANRAIQIVGQTAHLEFKLVRDDVDAERIARGLIPPGTEILPIKGKAGAPDQPILVDKEAMLTGEYISDAAPAIDSTNNQPYVRLSFNNQGAGLFERVTGENIGRRMAIVLDGKVHSAPVIQAKIGGGQASITGNFTAAEAQDLALVLRAGSLPAPVSIDEERTVGPSLGQQSIDQGIKAAVIGGIVVMLFMAVYYGISGLIANLMLVLDVVFILAGMAAFGATLTLPGIAGIVLTLGMAVDANVLIFERIREELRNGLSPIAAIRTGFSRATLTIVDSNLTTVIAAVVLYQFGTGPIRGFAVTLILGIIASMFTAVFVSHIIYDLWMGAKGRKLNMGLALIPNTLHFNFLGLRKIYCVAAVLVFVACLVPIIMHGGLKYGIDFAGGSIAQVQFKDSVNEEQVKTSLEATGLSGLVVQRFGDDDGQTFLIRVSSTAEDTTAKIRESIDNALASGLPGIAYDIVRLESVGPKVGADLRSKAVEAMYFATLFIAIYISGRFEQRWFVAGLMAAALLAGMYLLDMAGLSKALLVLAASIITLILCWKLKLVYALGALVSIFHDIFITVGLFAMMGKEFDLTIIAALLTILGYSLNDTIIVFDRIRENLKNAKGLRLSETINRSINQTLSRTVLTSGTTLIVVGSLLLFGGGIIHDFALIMFIGVIIGTLSSVFVASPILLIFGDTVVAQAEEEKKRREEEAKRERLAARARV